MTFFFARKPALIALMSLAAGHAAVLAAERPFADGRLADGRTVAVAPPAASAGSPAASIASTPALVAASTTAGAGSTTAAAAPEGGSVRVLVAAEQEATLFSQSIGHIRTVNATLGSAFKAGTTLVSFDCDEQNARVKMAQAESAAARETYNAKLRLQGLQSAGEVEVNLAASAAEKAAAENNLYRAQAAYCLIKAPFDGRVVSLHVKAFETVNQGAPLLDIISDGPLKLRLNVPSVWLKWLKMGDAFKVRIEETGKEYTARTTAINGRVDAVSQSIEIEGTIADRAPDLLPGMSGTAFFGNGR
jgi:membrane fusion protein (multidrug efflux system)